MTGRVEMVPQLPTAVGQFEAMPRLFVPLKNSTLVTKPSESRANASRKMHAGAVKTLPSGGVTMGGMFVGGGGGLVLTVMLTGSDVPVAPPLSVATAVSV